MSNLTVTLAGLALLYLCGTAWGQGKNWQAAGLNSHNKYRALHGSPPMTLADPLNKSAQQCAEYLAKNKIFDHVCGKKFGHKYGENLAWNSAYKSAEDGGVGATKMWYDEEPKYDYSKDGFQPAAGHFTQVVWKSSKQLGLGYAANGNFKVVVGHYNPAGNMGGQYKANVQRKK